MKRENNELDDFLQQKVDEAQFEFKESYWDKMEALLDEEEKPKKRFLFWRGLSVFLGVALLSTVAFLWPKMKQDSTQTASTAAHAENTQTQNFTQGSAASLEESSDEPQFNNVDTKAESTVTASGKSDLTSTPPAQATSHYTGPKEPRVKTAESNDSRQNSTVNPTQNNGSKGSVNTTPNATKNEKPLAQIEKKSKKPKRDKMNSGKGGAVNVKILHSNEGSSKNEAGSNEVNTKPSNPTSSPSVQVMGRNMKAIDTNVYYTKEPRDETQFNPRYIAALQNYTPERLEQVTVVTFAPAKEEVKEVKPVIEKAPQLQSQDTALTTKRKNPISWFAMLGANFNKGFKGNMLNTLPWGVSPFLSLGLEKKINSKISISTQVGFTYFNGLNMEQKATQYKYSFGLDSSEFFTVNYKRLWQVYVPVSLSYQLASRHQVFAGAAGSYALDVNSLVHDKQNSSVYTSNGYREGLSSWDVLAHIGYAYQFNSKISALLFWQQGFSDVTKNNAFRQDAKHLQSKVSVGIKYNFKRNGK